MGQNPTSAGTVVRGAPAGTPLFVLVPSSSRLAFPLALGGVSVEGPKVAVPSLKTGDSGWQSSPLG